MYHTAAFYLASGGAITNTIVPGLADPVLTLSSNGFLIPQDMMLLGGYLSGATLARGYFMSPHISQSSALYIRDVNLALLPPTNPPVCWFGPGFPRLIHQEVLSLYATDSAAGGEHIYGLADLALSIDPIPAGEMLNIYATSTSTATASTWTQIAYALANSLPVGQYAMVDSIIQCTTGVAHRWIFQNQVWRPGRLSIATLGLAEDWVSREYRRGVMGSFYSYALPNLEVLCNAGDTAFDIYIRLVKIA